MQELNSQSNRMTMMNMEMDYMIDRPQSFAHQANDSFSSDDDVGHDVQPEQHEVEPEQLEVEPERHDFGLEQRDDVPEPTNDEQQISEERVQESDLPQEVPVERDGSNTLAEIPDNY